jgi:PAS domain S-box-containing protein
VLKIKSYFILFFIFCINLECFSFQDKTFEYAVTEFKIGNIELIISVISLLIFLIILFILYKKHSNFDAKIIFKNQTLSQAKIEEIRIYVLFIALIAPFSEIFIYLFEIRKTNELLENIISGIFLLLIYIFSKKNIFIRKHIYKIFISFYIIFLISNLFKTILFEFELITYSEYLILIFFSYYIFIKNEHYLLFLGVIITLLISLYFLPTISIKEAVLISIITSIIIILNHVRQIVNYKNQEKLLFTDSIINNGVSLVIGSKPNGEVTYISENIIDILGYTPDEVLGQGWWEKTIDETTKFENEKRNIINQLLKEEISTRLIKTKSGEYKWIQWHDKKFSENLIVGIGQDITELKDLENENLIRQNKLQNQQNIITEINKIHLDKTFDFEKLIEKILKFTAEGLGIDIISLLEIDDLNMKVILLYRPKINEFNKGEIIHLNDYPIYFNALLNSKPIIANDVLSHDETQEFINGYFKDNDIKSLMDFPINIGGELKFILSCETTLELKNWDNDDINFVRNVADYISLTIENQKRIEAEKLVYESENIFRQMNETIDNVFWLFDIVNEKVIYISPSCKRILGVDQNNFYKDYDYWKNYILEEDKSNIKNNHKNIATQGFYDIEYRIKKGNEIRWINEKSYAIQDENGKIIKASGICTDITEDKLIRIELKQLSLIAEKTTNGVSVSDKDGRVSWVNQGYLDLFEIENEEILGKIPREVFIANNDELKERINSLNGSNYKIEFQVTTFKQNKIWVEVNNTVIKNNSDEIIQQIDVVTDITERVLNRQKIENQSLVLEEYAKDLEYQNKLKEKLIHADNLEDVCYNALSFIFDQFNDTNHITMVFPDINETYYNGFTLIDNVLIAESYLSSELFCLDKAKNGEIYFR